MIFFPLPPSNSLIFFKNQQHLIFIRKLKQNRILLLLTVLLLDLCVYLHLYTLMLLFFSALTSDSSKLTKICSLNKSSALLIKDFAHDLYMESLTVPHQVPTSSLPLFSYHPVALRKKSLLLRNFLNSIFI